METQWHLLVRRINTQAAPTMRRIDGVTKREHFAAMAMQGLCSHEEIGLESETKIAKVAVRQADALIVALNND